MPPLFPSARTRPWRWLLAVAVLSLVLAAAQRGWVAWRHHALAALDGARWIWAADALSSTGDPIAFFAVRDFTLHTAPEQASLLITADEVYLVWLNGRLVGSNSYLPGVPVDLYAVAAHLEAGNNRIVVELRSGRGAGGLLAALRIGEPATTILTTDASWRIVRGWDRVLYRSRRRGDETSEPAVVWGTPPTGRWRPRWPAMARPALPASVENGGAIPERCRGTLEDGDWQPLEPTSHASAFSTPVKLFDWGREVEGHLALELRPQSEQLGLLYFGTEIPDPKTRHADEVLIAAAGTRPWRSAHPHRFRYALLVGGDLRGLPSAEPLDPELARQLAARPLETFGVWGLRPAFDRLKIEELVRTRY